MVGRPGKYQPRFTAGELDPLIQANTDEAIYFKGASAFRNVKPVPQGGFTGRWGTVMMDVVRSRVTLYSATAANSGVSSNAPNVIDGLSTTYMTTGAVTGGFQAVVVDFGAVQPMTWIDVEQFALQVVGGAFPTISEPSPPIAPALSATMTVSLSADNVNWTQIDGARFVGDTLRTRRFALPPGQTVQARLARIDISNPSPANGTTLFVLASVRGFAENGNLSPVRIRSFTHSRDVAYDIVFTDQNAEVYSAAGRVASISTALTSTPSLSAALVAAMKNTQQLDTMLLFHQAIPPFRIFRQGSDTEWNSDAAPLTNIPNYDFGAGYSNGVAAQWQLSFFGFDAATGSIAMPSGGAHFTISVNGVASPAIQQPPNSYSGTAAAIQAAILALPGVAPGVTVALTSIGTVTGTPPTTQPPPVFTVTFGGAGNQGNGWAVSGACIDKADAAITAANTVAGVLGGEPIMSVTRGYPGCGVFYQQRLVLAGFAALPNAFLASETGNYWQFSTALTGAQAPMLVPIDTDGAATIVDVHNGRTLDFFCDAGEYWLSTGALDASTTPVIVRGTTNGIAPTVDAFENEGKTYYAAKNGGTLFEFVFNYAEQNYDSNNISVANSSVVQNVVDAALRRLTGSTDVNELYCVRGDGQAFLLNLLRQQDIVSFARFVTDGQFLAVNVNDRFEVTWAVARQVNGQTVQFLEKMTDGVVLDCQTSVAVTAGQTVISGLTNHVGATVFAIVDGFVQGPFTAAGGAITLNFPAEAAGAALVGRWTAPYVATLPQPRDVAPRTVVRRPCRVHTVRATVVGTSNLAIGANGDGPYDAPLTQYGGAADVPPMSAPYTGPVVSEGLQGYSDDGIVVFTQTRPGLLTVTGVTVEVDL